MLELKIRAKFGTDKIAFAIAIRDMFLEETGIKMEQFEIKEEEVKSNGNGYGEPNWKRPSLPAVAPGSPDTQPEIPKGLRKWKRKRGSYRTKASLSKADPYKDPRMVFKMNHWKRRVVDVEKTLINLNLTLGQLLNGTWKEGTIEFVVRRSYLSSKPRQKKEEKTLGPATTQEILGGLGPSGVSPC